LAYPKSPATRAIRTMASSLAPAPQKDKKGFSLPFASFFKKKSKKGKDDDNLAGATL